MFRESYVENAAIIENPETPIFVFHRSESKGPFAFAGDFRNTEIHEELDGSKWFELVLRDSAEARPLVDEAEHRRDFNRRVAQAGSSNGQQRRARLAKAPKKPGAVTVVSTAYIRNPDVVAEVLERAGGTCEGCKEVAPFNRNSNGTPYLEVHHKVRLSEGGDDTVENALALCPNCHRREHFGPRKWQ